MALPVNANTFKLLVVDVASSVCSRWSKMIQLSVQLYRFFSYILDNDGNFTANFKALVSDVTIRVGDLIFSAAPLDEVLRLKCDGRAVSRTTYAALYAKIGTIYGAGDGSTTFNIPNYTDRFPKGKGSEDVGTSGGAATVTLDTNTMRHVHATGRFEGTTSGAKDDWFGYIDDVNADGPSGNARQCSGDVQTIEDADVSGKTGPFTYTSQPLAQDNDPPAPDAFSIMPSYVSCFIYIYVGPTS